MGSSLKKLYLVDVSSMFFRAFYAIPPLRTSSGLPTNALYGFLSMSIKLLRENRPDYMAFCFDRKEPSFRAELFEDYKANRTEMPEDLSPQIPYIRELTEKLGIRAIDKERFEADDVIGTLALLGQRHNLDVSIVSGDKDFAQLVSDRIALYDTMKNIRYDRDGVVQKWGVYPEQMVDYLAIVGDTSDNIPGVHGVGPKGAQKLLSEYKTLEGIYEHLSEIKSESTRAKFLESKKNAFLAKKLVQIVTDVPLAVEPEDLALKPIQKEDLKTLLDQLEFGAFLKKIFPGDESVQVMNPQDVQSQFEKRPGKKPTQTSAKAKSGSGSLSSNESVVGEISNKTGESNSPIDVAQLISGVLPLKPVQWSLEDLKKNMKPYEDVWAVDHERGFCLGYKEWVIQVDAELKQIGDVLGHKNLLWYGFDLKRIWRRLEVKNPPTPKWDTQLAAYVVRAGAIDDFSEVYTQHVGKKVPDLAGAEEFLHCERELHAVLSAKLERFHGAPVLTTLELPLVPVLYQMEAHGIYVNTNELKSQSIALGADIARLEKTIHKEAGESFNVASPKQLAAILFEKLKIPVVKKTKTGYSTDSDVLMKLSKQYPICDHVIEFRELTKLKSTYVDALPQLADPKTNRIHTHFQQAVTQTGRLSSINPNLQNIPIRTERGRLVRRAFQAPEGSVLLSVDYSQIELRVLAEITGDPGLIEAFRNDQDIHATTAAEIFSVSIDEVTADQRRMAKAVNFGIAYGQGPFGLAETLEISQTEAKKIIADYFHRFKKVKDYMLEVVQTAKERGYVETLFGRRRYMDEFKSSSQMVQKFGERAAINAPIQGTASDLMKLAMIKVFEGNSTPILLQVHDELVFECPEDSIETEAQNIKQIMENVAQFKVPLRVNVAWGKNWDEAH